MSVQGLINEVKTVLRTEGLPLTDAELARMMGRVAQTLSTLIPLLPVRHQISTTKAGEYLLPNDIVLIERVVYKPSASATIVGKDTIRNELILRENVRERGWAENGIALGKTNGVRQRYRIVSNYNIAVELAAAYRLGDTIEEDTEAIELPLQAITAPNEKVRGVAGDTASYAVGLFGQWLRLSPDKKAGHENLTIYAYASHPPIADPTDTILLPPYTASYLVYETAHRVLLQFAGEEAPPLLQALKSRAVEELQILMTKSATVQNPPSITFYRRRRDE
jgi:hypothetical protein